MPRSGRNDGGSSLKYRDLMVKPEDDGREEHDRRVKGRKKKKRWKKREDASRGLFLLWHWDLMGQDEILVQKKTMSVFLPNARLCDFS